MSGRSNQLNRLTLFRLVIITLLLLLTQQDWVLHGKGTQIFPPWSMNWLVGGFYLLTLVYLLWLRTGRQLELLTVVQCALDPILIALLVILSGGLASPFHFLFALSVLNTALLLGRHEAMLSAVAIVLLSFVAVSLPDWIPFTYWRIFETDWHLVRRMVINGMAFFLTAWLGGALTEQAKRLQAALDQQRDSLADLAALNQQIVGAIPYGLLSINRQGIIRSVNAGVGDLLSSPPSDLVGRPVTAIFPNLPWLLPPSHDPPRDGGEFIHGERILGLTTSPLLNHRQQPIGTLLVVRDLTGQKRMEREMAEQAKLAMMGRMAAFLAHEIRNPLASILSAAEMLQKTEVYEQRHRLQTIVLEEVGRLSRLTTDILSFAKPPVPKRSRIALSSFLDHVYPALCRDPTWGENHDLNLAMDPGLHVLFDFGHLRQVCWNLLLNAAQATPAQGTVTVVGHRQGSLVRLVFSDNGPGLPDELLEQVMEPFFSTRAGGTGLGLPVVAQLVRINSGAIDLANGKSGGLEVTLTLEAPDGPDPDL